MKRSRTPPVTPAERRARRTQRLILGAGLGLAVLVALLLVQGPWRDGVAVRGRYTDLQARLAGHQAALGLARRIGADNARLIDGARVGLEEYLPRTPDEKRWFDRLLAASHSFGLEQVKIRVKDVPEEVPTEAPADLPNEDDIGSSEPLVDVRSIRYQLKAVGRLREVLGFVDSLRDLSPMMRAAKMSIKRLEEVFDQVELDVTVSCFWRRLASSDVG